MLGKARGARGRGPAGAVEPEAAAGVTLSLLLGTPQATALLQTRGAGMAAPPVLIRCPVSFSVSETTRKSLCNLIVCFQGTSKRLRGKISIMELTPLFYMSF